MPTRFFMPVPTPFFGHFSRRNSLLGIFGSLDVGPFRGIFIPELGCILAGTGTRLRVGRGMQSGRCRERRPFEHSRCPCTRPDRSVKRGFWGLGPPFHGLPGFYCVFWAPSREIRPFWSVWRASAKRLHQAFQSNRQIFCGLSLPLRADK